MLFRVLTVPATGTKDPCITQDYFIPSILLPGSWSMCQGLVWPDTLSLRSASISMKFKMNMMSMYYVTRLPTTVCVRAFTAVLKWSVTVLQSCGINSRDKCENYVIERCISLDATSSRHWKKWWVHITHTWMVSCSCFRCLAKQVMFKTASCHGAVEWADYLALTSRRVTMAESTNAQRVPTA